MEGGCEVEDATIIAAGESRERSGPPRPSPAFDLTSLPRLGHTSSNHHLPPKSSGTHCERDAHVCCNFGKALDLQQPLSNETPMQYICIEPSNTRVSLRHSIAIKCLILRSHVATSVITSCGMSRCRCTCYKNDKMTMSSPLACRRRCPCPS